MQRREFIRGRSIIAALDHGADIIDQITSVVRDERIEMGTFYAIGALARAELGYYDQTSLEYIRILINRPVELISCSGNVSLKEDQPFVHAHAILGDKDGNVVGGHLFGGSIFATELHLEELLGKPLKREYDSVTGLNLWSKD